MSASTLVPAVTSGASEPSTQSAATGSMNTVPPSKPPLEIHPTAHLDPQAYVQGAFTITLGANVVVHPRARLLSIHGPLDIGSGAIISERCAVGGPGPDPKEPAVQPPTELARTTIGQNVMLHASSEIQAGASLDDACSIEPRAVVKQGVNIGKHSKVCAGCDVGRSVRDWTVVWGGGHVRRRRTEAEGLENGRLKGLGSERDATARLLRATAAKATLGRRKG